MDPFELLKSDHKKVAELFERIENASGKAKSSIFERIRNELEIHTQVEEDIFYPALRKAEETRDITLEAYEEHRVVKELLAELAAGKPSDQWDAKLTVLKENVEHHVDEEEDEMFGKAKDVLSTEEVDALGDRIAAEKRRLGAPVPEEDAKPGVIKRAINALFGSDPKKAGKKKGGKKKAAATSSTTPTKRNSPKKSVGGKKTGTKKAGKKTAKKAPKKSTGTKRAKRTSAKKR